MTHCPTATSQANKSGTIELTDPENHGVGANFMGLGEFGEPLLAQMGPDHGWQALERVNVSLMT